jgi:hypothetical protein
MSLKIRWKTEELAGLEYVRGVATTATAKATSTLTITLRTITIIGVMLF